MLTYHPVTPARWDDLVRLFEHHGNPGYCWCTYWRLPANEYSSLNSAGRKAVLAEKVGAGQPVGLLAYQDERPVAWCSIAPRESYLRLERSKTILPTEDGLRTWAIVCFYLDRSVRRQNIGQGLLRAALDYAHTQGAEAVEAYPVEPKPGPDGKPDYHVTYSFMGFLSTYIKAGFQDVTPTGSSRRVVQYIFGE